MQHRMANRGPRSTLYTISNWLVWCYLSPPNIRAGFPFVVNGRTLLTSALACNHWITTTQAYISPNIASLTFYHHPKSTAIATHAKIFLSSLYLRSLIFFPNENQPLLHPWNDRLISYLYVSKLSVALPGRPILLYQNSCFSSFLIMFGQGRLALLQLRVSNIQIGVCLNFISTWWWSYWGSLFHIGVCLNSS